MLLIWADPLNLLCHWSCMGFQCGFTWVAILDLGKLDSYIFCEACMKKTSGIIILPMLLNLVCLVECLFRRVQNKWTTNLKEKLSLCTSIRLEIFYSWRILKLFIHLHYSLLILQAQLILVKYITTEFLVAVWIPIDLWGSGGGQIFAQYLWFG